MLRAATCPRMDGGGDPDPVFKCLILFPLPGAGDPTEVWRYLARLQVVLSSFNKMGFIAH